MSKWNTKKKQNWSTEHIMVTKEQKREMVKRAMAGRHDTMSELVQELLDAHSYCTSNNLQFRPVPMQNAQPGMQDA